MPSIKDLSPEPRYNIQIASQRTGIQPVTLRAWERRYHLLQPQREDNHYRLYSERDLAVLVWVKKQIENGVKVSIAAKEMQMRIDRNDWPESAIPPSIPLSAKHTNLSARQFAVRLFQQLVNHNEAAAVETFNEAQVAFNLFTLFESVLTPCLVEIGEGWYRGEIRIATEHFASGFIRARLMAIFQVLPIKHGNAQVLVGGAPGELHEIGALMIAILLRSSGLRVEYLGPDLQLDDLLLYVKYQHPKMIILSATIAESTRALGDFNHRLEEFRSSPLFGFGGGAFVRNPELINLIPGCYLGNSQAQSVQTVLNLLLKG